MRVAAAVVTLVLCLSVGANAQTVRQDVTFPTLAQDHVTLTARLMLPAGAGPFPAMVLLHTCAGLTGTFIDNWAAWFVSKGYAALVVDSFGPRHVRNVCGGGLPTMRTRGFDALGALAYLRTRPEIDPARIGAIGWSHGASAAYFADSAALVRGALPNASGFAAAIALYPSCAQTSSITALAAPLLFLLGEADDWTPAAACQVDATRLAAGAVPMTVHVYPGATHAFDNPAGHGIVHVGTHIYTLVFDPGAAADAHDRILAFLAGVMR